MIILLGEKLCTASSIAPQQEITKMNWYPLAVGMERMGIETILGGLAIEIKKRASPDLVLIMAGAALVALGFFLLFKVL